MFANSQTLRRRRRPHTPTRAHARPRLVMSAARGLAPLRRTVVVTAPSPRVSAPSAAPPRSSQRARPITTRASTDDAHDDVERVTSVDNAAVKHFAKLCKSKAYRDERGSVVLASSVLMRECFGEGRATTAKTLFVAERAQIPDGISARRIVRAPPHVMKKCAGVANADGLDCVGEFEAPKIARSREFVAAAKRRRTTRVLALEGVQDPGNVGTLTRTAVAFGWEYVALLPGTCDPFNDKAMRAARGATFRVDFVAFDSFEELARAGEELGMELYAAEPSAERDVDPERAQGVDRACLVLGTEGKGLSEEALRTCEPVAVPMSGDMESLNVGVAGSVLMYLMKPSARR